MGLGNIIDKAGLTKSNLKEAAKLGAGAGAFPFVYGLLQSQVLLRASPTTFAQGTPAEMATRAIAGVVLGHVTGKMLKQPAMGDGMVASAVGSVVRDLVAPMFNPAVAVTQAAITATEQATGQPQASDVNPTGSGMAGLRGLGNMRYGRDPSILFGVGTPDMSATNMFNGATVAIENGNGPMAGATVAVEPESRFAASFGA